MNTIKPIYSDLYVAFKGANGTKLGKLNSEQLNTLADIALASKDKSLLQLFEQYPISTKTDEVLAKLNHATKEQTNDKAASESKD